MINVLNNIDIKCKTRLIGNALPSRPFAKWRLPLQAEHRPENIFTDYFMQNNQN